MPRKNRDKFYELFGQYSKPSDSLKLKASFFLLENMENKYAVHYQHTDNYYRLLDYIDTYNPLTLKSGRLDHLAKHDSLDYLARDWIDSTPLSFGNSIIKKDIDEVSVDLLKENIDYAFKAWEEMPWSKHIDFDVFCEYILPYRSYNEPLSSWRKLYYNHYSWLKDSLSNVSDPVEACSIVNNYLSNNQFLFMNTLAGLPFTTASDLEKYRVGTCDPRTLWVQFVMRSIGIPVAIDLTPAYTNKPLKHTWMVVLDTNNLSVAFNGGGFGGETDASYIVPTDTRSVSKVYRNTFKSQNILNAKGISGRDFFEYFPNQNYIDVSDEYKYPKVSYNFKLNTEKFSEFTGAPLYLCCFGYGGHLIPVDVEAPESNSNLYSFANIACEPLYVVAALKDNQLIPVGNPVTFNTVSKDAITYDPDYQNRQNLNLYRKFQPSEAMMCFANKMNNGQFEGANKSDFSDAVCLYKISKDEIVPYYTDFDLLNKKSFRFYRYIPKNNTAHLAELSFTSRVSTSRDFNLVSTIYNPGRLDENTIYYWKVVARPFMEPDEAPVWSFATGSDFHEEEQVKVNISASSSFSGNYNPEKIIDGIKGLSVDGEWASKSELYPWLKLEFEESIELSKIIVYDRENLHDHLISGVLTFNDGSSLKVVDIPNDGSAFELNFNPKTVKTILFQVTKSSGTNIGLSEIELFSSDGERVIKQNKEFFPDVKSFPFPVHNSTNIRSDVKLCWKPKQNAESYDIYFGKEKSPSLVCNQVISAIGNAEQSELKNTFDGDIRTNCNLSINAWVGVDFGPNNHQVVNKIRYLVRNNFNIIEKGNNYDLRYFDHGWHSLGVQVAEHNYLNFFNVPSNTILWLHNNTQGNEERVFEYKNNQQIWW